MGKINCVNCGAILKNKKCEYCGADYNEGFELELQDEINGIIRICGEEIPVYCSEVDVTFFCDCYRDFDGMLHRYSNKKRKFTLIEY